MYIRRIYTVNRQKPSVFFGWLGLFAAPASLRRQAPRASRPCAIMAEGTEPEVVTVDSDEDVYQTVNSTKYTPEQAHAYLIGLKAKNLKPGSFWHNFDVVLSSGPDTTQAGVLCWMKCMTCKALLRPSNPSRVNAEHACTKAGSSSKPPQRASSMTSSVSQGMSGKRGTQATMGTFIPGADQVRVRPE